MNTPAVVGNLDTITAEILILKRQTLGNLLEIGRRLIQAKQLVGHGNWGRYLQTQVEFSERTANRFMRAAESMENSPALADLEQTKAMLLLEAPEDEREALAEQAPSLTTRQLEAKVREVNEERRKREEAERREAEAQKKLQAAQREAIENERKAAEATAKATRAEQELRNRPRVEVQVEKPVIMPDPRTVQALEQARKELAEAQREKAELLATAQGTAEARRALEQAQAKVKLMEQRLRRLSVQFDDSGMDAHGGTKLMDAVEPLFRTVANAVAEARVLKKVGVGGECDDNAIGAMIPQLRELADHLEAMLQDRRNRPIDITPSEV